MKIRQYIPPADSEESRPPEKKYPMRRVVRSDRTGSYKIAFCKEDGQTVANVVDSEGIRYRDVEKTLLFKGYSIDFADWDDHGKFIQENGTVEIKDWHPGVADESHEEPPKKYPMWRTVIDGDGQFQTIFCDVMGKFVSPVISQGAGDGVPFSIPGTGSALYKNGYETDFAEWTDQGEFVRFKEGFVDREKMS